MSALEFGIKITAINAAGSVLRGVRDNIKSIAQSNRQVKKAYDDTIKSMTRAATAAVATAAAIKGIGKGVGAAAEVSDAIANARAELIRANKPTQQLNDELGKIRQSATEIQGVTMFDTKQIIDAQVMLLKAGKTMEEVTDASDGLAVTIAQVATIMEDTPENVSTGFLKVSDTFLDAEHSARNLADTITKASGTANTNFTEMATVIGRAGGFAKAAGIDFEDMVAGAALAFNKFAGQPERLSTAMQEFFSRAKDVDALIEDGQLVELPEIVSRLNERFDGMTSQKRLQEIERMFGKSAYLSLFLTTLLDEGAEGFSDLNAEMAQMPDLAEKSAAKMNTLNRQLEIARGTFRSLIGEVFKDLEVSLARQVTLFNDLLARITKYIAKTPAVSKAGTAFAATVGLAGTALTGIFTAQALFSGAKLLKGVGGIRGLLGRGLAGGGGLAAGLAKGKALEQAGVAPVYVVNANEIGGGLANTLTQNPAKLFDFSNVSRGGKTFGVLPGVGGILGANVLGKGGLAAAGIGGIATIAAAVIGSAAVGVAAGSLFNKIIEGSALDNWLQKAADKIFDIFNETGEERVKRLQKEAEAARALEKREKEARGVLSGDLQPGIGFLTETAESDRGIAVVVNTYIDSKKANPEKVHVEETKDFDLGAADSIFTGSDTTVVRR